jgi:hypothetical protein
MAMSIAAWALSTDDVIAATSRRSPGTLRFPAAQRGDESQRPPLEPVRVIGVGVGTEAGSPIIR